MLKTIIALAIASVLSYGQNLNQQMNDNSILEFTNATDGSIISFSVKEARETFKQVFDKIKPTLKENSGWPPYMKEKLDWAINKAYWSPHPKLPDNWSKGPIKKGDSEVYAEFTYCTPRADLGLQPCILAYVNAMMFTFRSGYPLYRTPPQSFINVFAVLIAHEAIHAERGKDYFLVTHDLEEQIREEIRALSKTIIDIIHPLRLAKYTFDPVLEEPEKLLEKCSYKMPCKAFSDYVRQIKTPTKIGK